MSAHTIYEIIGYIASLLVAISLMMSSVVRLRLLNLVGAATFVIYGAVIGAYPVALMNLFIVVINIVYLRRLSRTSEYFQFLEIHPNSEYVRYFLDFYAREIRRTQPGFRYDPSSKPLTVFILRDLVPAGLFIAQEMAPGTMKADLDFAIPSYRDYKMGKFLYDEHAEIFLRRGVRTIVTEPGDAMHQQYLRRMGFRPDAAGLDALWARDLRPATVPPSGRA